MITTTTSIKGVSEKDLLKWFKKSNEDTMETITKFIKFEKKKAKKLPGR